MARDQTNRSVEQNRHEGLLRSHRFDRLILDKGHGQHNGVLPFQQVVLGQLGSMRKLTKENSEWAISMHLV